MPTHLGISVTNVATPYFLSNPSKMELYPITQVRAKDDDNTTTGIQANTSNLGQSQPSKNSA